MEILAPAPAREALVARPGEIITPPWQRWLSDLQRLVLALQAQLDALPAGPFQPLDATLSTLAALVGTANTLPYFSGTDVAALTALTAFARTLLAGPDAAAMQATLGLDASVLQTTTQTVAVSGAAVLTYAAMAPAGAEVHGVTWRVSETFTGTLTGLLVGDAVVADRWGQAPAPVAGTTGSSAAWRGPGGFTTPGAYAVLAAPVGAGFGGAGALTCACTWLAALPAP
jgi:hypothetical protein